MNTVCFDDTAAKQAECPCASCSRVLTTNRWCTPDRVSWLPQWFCSAVVCLTTIAMWAASATAEVETLDLIPAQSPYVVADHAEVLLLEPHWYDDASTIEGSFRPLEDILAAAAAGSFAPVTTRHVGAGLSDVTVHTRLRVGNPTETPQDWIFAFNRSARYAFRLYYVEDGQPLPASPLFAFDVDQGPWADADVQVHAPFTLPAKSSGYLYTSLVSLNSAAPMTIETPEDYQAKRRLQDWYFFGVTGIVFGLVLLTVSLMVMMRRFVVVYYAAAVISGLTLVLTSEQYLFSVFPKLGDVILSDVLLSYSALFGPVFALIFQRQFLSNVGGMSKAYGRILLFTALICVASMIAVVEFEAIIPLIIPIIALAACTLLIMINGVIALRRGFVGRWSFFIGSIAYAIGLLVKVSSFELSWLVSGREASLIMLHLIAVEAIALSGTMFLQVREMRHARERATKDKLEMAKALAHAAHDIRQPLASMRMVMANAPEAPRHAEIQNALSYLEDIVKTQLTTGSESIHNDGDREEEPRVFPLMSVLKNLDTMFAAEAEEKGLYLRLGETKAHVAADIVVVMRLVANLVSNAIKNTQSGGVQVTCTETAQNVTIDIIDTGQGLAVADLEDLQKPYVRSADYEGNGLGLSIVRELSDSHGYPLKFSSQPDVGTKVSLTLPLG